MRHIQDSKWDGFQSPVLKEVAKVIPESFAINYLRELQRRETEVTVNTGRLENSKYSIFSSEWGKSRTVQMKPDRYCGKVLNNHLISAWRKYDRKHLKRKYKDCQNHLIFFDSVASIGKAEDISYLYYGNVLQLKLSYNGEKTGQKKTDQSVVFSSFWLCLEAIHIFYRPVLDFH